MIMHPVNWGVGVPGIRDIRDLPGITGTEDGHSKRRGALDRSSRSAHWVKVKNPKVPAVKRETEEDWTAE
jgi:hypothetical protein